MNFAAARPLGLPRVLAPPPEEAQKAKTPTPEPFDSETRKVSPTLLGTASPPSTLPGTRAGRPLCGAGAVKRSWGTPFPRDSLPYRHPSPTPCCLCPRSCPCSHLLQEPLSGTLLCPHPSDATPLAGRPPDVRVLGYPPRPPPGLVLSRPSCLAPCFCAHTPLRSLWLCPCGYVHGHCPAPGTSIPYLEAPQPPFPAGLLPLGSPPHRSQNSCPNSQRCPQRPWGPQRGLGLGLWGGLACARPVLRPLLPPPSAQLPLHWCKLLSTRARGALQPLPAPVPLGPLGVHRSCSSVAESEPSWVTLGPPPPPGDPDAV